jgi:hypothetical protein
MKRLGFLTILAVSSLVLIGCATTQSGYRAPITGDALADGKNAIAQVPARDRVLWQYRTALVALRRGEYDEAKRLFDDAILSMGGTLAHDKSARRARSVFSGESKKTFIGEPYERVMAYYYRGLLYWMDGEPDNARACFRSAQFLDADNENKDYTSDYILLEYLDGLASTKLTADGSDSFKRAQALFKGGALPTYSMQANTLFFVEFGPGPQKYASGQYGEQLRFRCDTSHVRSATIRVANQTINAGPYDDLYYQATTRGGRVMDHILANKAVFKSSTDSVGDAAIMSGAVLGVGGQGRRNNVDEVGLGLVAFGLVSKLVSAAATPSADTRCWDNLPQFLTFAAISLPPGEHVATIEFKDSAGRAIPSLTKTVSFTVVPARDAVVFVGDQSQNSQTL